MKRGPIAKAVIRTVKLQEFTELQLQLFDTDFGFYWAHYAFPDKIAARHHFYLFKEQQIWQSLSSTAESVPAPVKNL